MYRANQSLLIVGFTVATWLALGAPPAEAQQLRIENAYPRQLPIGQTTIVNAVLANPNGPGSGSVAVAGRHGYRHLSR